MIIQAEIACVLRVNDEVPIVFTEHEPMVIPALCAVPLLINFYEKVEVVSSVCPGSGCEVTWMDAHGQSRSGLVLLRFQYLEECWVFVHSNGTGRFIRTSEIIGVNPRPLFCLARDAMHTVETHDAQRMAEDVVMHLCGLDPQG